MTIFEPWDDRSTLSVVQKGLHGRSSCRFSIPVDYWIDERKYGFPSFGCHRGMIDGMRRYDTHFFFSHKSVIIQFDGYGDENQSREGRRSGKGPGMPLWLY